MHNAYEIKLFLSISHTLGTQSTELDDSFFSYVYIFHPI